MALHFFIYLCIIIDNSQPEFMTRLRFIIVLCTMLLCGFSAEAKKYNTQASYETYSCTIDGIERTYKLYLPANIKPNAPLIFVLHGYGGSNNLDFLGLNPRISCFRPNAGQKTSKKILLHPNDCYFIISKIRPRSAVYT